MKTLYKRAKNGKIQQWTIEVRDDKYRTHEGYVNGQITTSKWTVCTAKNVGKSNEVTAKQQAVREATSKWKKKQERGYTPHIDFIDDVHIIDPMLAHKWRDYESKVSDDEPLASQPKLDGIRCIGTKNGLFTRKGKRIVAVPHIEQEVKKILEGLPENYYLDGELYNHELKDDFNKITSIVRKQKPTEKDIELAESLIQYHVYDIDAPGSFAMRYQSLIELFAFPQRKVVLVKTIFLANKTSALLDKLYQQYLEQGYEGQIIRISNSEYKNGRSRNLLKRKEFIDQEFTIIDIEEGTGNRSGMMGRIKFDGFDANARGSHAYWKELLRNKDIYIGKQATVRFQNWTPDGKPRFPVVVAIRDYE